jgi:lipoprotein-anchoring transpeptidase ErfK/SrfK
MVMTLALAGSIGVAAAQYYPPQPPPVYPADSSQPYPAGSYSDASPLPGQAEAYPPPSRPYFAPNNQYPPQPQTAPGDAQDTRPPAGIEGAAAPGEVTGSVPNSAGTGSTSTVAALPPEYQPEQGPPQELPPQFRRQIVDYPTNQPPRTIVVDTMHTYLYLVLGHGKALRYGIGVGREGFTWSGTERISRMKEWPDWYPPKEMIARQPYLPRFMAGGETNPLGARALYLGNTLYRIHGTNQPSTIGTYVSSGCIRLTNDNIEDLYDRVTVGTRVVVLPGEPPPNTASAQAPASR